MPPRRQVLLAIPKLASRQAGVVTRASGARLAAAAGSPPRLAIEDTVLDLVNDPDCDERAAISWLAAAVQARRGWSGPPTRCPNCRRAA